MQYRTFHIYMYLVGVLVHTHFKDRIHYTIYITVGSFMDGCLNSLLQIKLVITESLLVCTDKYMYTCTSNKIK